jgi:hypothetical protein
MNYHVQHAPLAATTGKTATAYPRRPDSFSTQTPLEVFAADGPLCLPMGKSLAIDNRSFSIQAQGGAAEIHRIEFHELSLAWCTAVAE